jgi:hypothetical protein
MLTLAHALNLEMTPSEKHPELHQRFRTLKTHQDAARYIREVETTLSKRRRK